MSSGLDQSRERRWIAYEEHPGLTQRLAHELAVSELLAKLLINRGVRDANSGRVFLRPRLTNLQDPFLLPDMERACERIRAALRDGDEIVIYGDYDADGVTATALLLRFFRLAGGKVGYYVPTRIGEGYGLNARAIQKLARGGAKLVVTVDCGVTALDEADQARELGIDLIITDHHEPRSDGKLPKAYAVVCPDLPTSRYPFKPLAGVGVAFKLAWAVAHSVSRPAIVKGVPISERFQDFLLDAVGLAALGTIADVVPVNGENRIIARYGLDALSQSTSPGIRALMTVSGTHERPMDSWDIGFRLGPRLNVAGRLGDARRGVELLTTESIQEAERLARELDRENTERQKIQQDILEEVRERVDRTVDVESERVIVLADERWHPGVIGIVASKIAEDFYRPTVLISLDGKRGRGSARSITGFNLVRAVEQCEELLESFGGHSGAAGIIMKRGNVAAFRKKINDVARAVLDEKDLIPIIQIDAETSLPELTQGVVEELQLLSPHGDGNPPPLLASRGCAIAGVPRRVGREGKHLKFYVHQGTATLDAIAFGRGESAGALSQKDARWSIAYEPTIDRWRGRTKVQLDVKDIIREG